MQSKENTDDYHIEVTTNQHSLNDVQYHQHQPVYRLHHQIASCDSVESGEPQHCPRHDITDDYYLSEEEELSMIAHQSKHFDPR